MSGGGGGGGPPAGPPAGPMSCDDLKFNTRLSNPNPAAFATISIGQVLRVSLEVDADGINVIRARDAAGDEVGAIITRVPDLIRCIQQHVQFEAEIAAVTRPAIDVAVRPA